MGLFFTSDKPKLAAQEPTPFVAKPKLRTAPVELPTQALTPCTKQPYLADGLPLLPGCRGKAEFAYEGRSRLSLWRDWYDVVGSCAKPKEPYVCSIGMNPSCANSTQDDKTIRNDIAFADRMGFKSLCKVNLFGLCATKPDDLLLPENENLVFDWHNNISVVLNSMSASIVIAAWGVLDGKLRAHAEHMSRRLIASSPTFQMYCYGVTQDGSPRHTSRLAHNTPLHPWKGY